MSSSPAQASDPYTPLTADELSQALKVEVYDEDGKSKTLGELTKGRRTALAFTRHFCKCIRFQLIVYAHTKNSKGVSTVKTMCDISATPFRHQISLPTLKVRHHHFSTGQDHAV
jgi:hypothetical protein